MHTIGKCTVLANPIGKCTAVMADFVKVAVARDRDEGHEVTKIW